MTRTDRLDRERWIASGLPDAIVTLMFRDGTLPPPHAARWYDSSLTTAEIVEFRRAGRPAPDEAFQASLAARGLPSDPAFVAAWQGFDAEQILGAIDRGFTSAEQYRPWAETDADVTEVERLTSLGPPDRFDAAKVLRQLRAGRSAEEIAFALESGLKPKKVTAWMRRGLSATAARRWSAAGFSPSDAARWIEVVDDPGIARLMVLLHIDVESASAHRPEDGWTEHAVRRHLVETLGVPGDLADEWASTPVSDRRLAEWATADVRPDQVAGWLDLGIRPEPAAAWTANGFGPDEAAPWHAAGLDPEVAARRRDIGARPPRPTESGGTRGADP
jgi:hypothetical protein